VYACICAAVTDAAVEAVVCRGAGTREDVEAETGAGSGCGSCHDHVCDIIERLTRLRTSAGAAAK
jgi:bacterioferritin-associated ferredoxin